MLELMLILSTALPLIFLYESQEEGLKKEIVSLLEKIEEQQLIIAKLKSQLNKNKEEQ